MDNDAHLKFMKGNFTCNAQGDNSNISSNKSKLLVKRGTRNADLLRSVGGGALWKRVKTVSLGGKSKLEPMVDLDNHKEGGTEGQEGPNGGNTNSTPNSPSGTNAATAADKDGSNNSQDASKPQPMPEEERKRMIEE